MKTATPRPTYEELLTINAALQQSNENLQLEVFRLQEQLSRFQRLLFGQKRERFVSGNDGQLSLDLDIEAQEPSSAAESEQITYTRRKRSQPEKPPVRAPLPAHLPRKEIVIEPEEDISGMKKIGEEITEELCQRHAFGRI